MLASASLLARPAQIAQPVSGKAWDRLGRGWVPASFFWRPWSSLETIEAASELVALPETLSVFLTLLQSDLSQTLFSKGFFYFF